MKFNDLNELFETLGKNKIIDLSYLKKLLFFVNSSLKINE